jgi:hypothetical protein
MLAAQHMAQSIAAQASKPIPLPEGGGDRNAIPIYKFSNAHVVHHFIPENPLRVSAMRSLGAYHNVFSIESFMDELASAAGADPVEFRLKHLDDLRGREVIKRAAQDFGWRSGQKATRGRGFGFAFARYKNLAAYCAVASEVEVDRETGRPRLVRAVAAVDSGQVVNPDGLINQIEGAIVQSMSWTLYESVTFDDRRITSIDWQTYPILRFNSVPDSIEVHIINRPGQPFLGSGETGQGPAAASIANAIAKRHRQAATQFASHAEADQGSDRSISCFRKARITWRLINAADLEERIWGSPTNELARSRIQRSDQCRRGRLRRRRQDPGEGPVRLRLRQPDRRIWQFRQQGHHRPDQGGSRGDPERGPRSRRS